MCGAALGWSVAACVPSELGALIARGADGTQENKSPLDVAVMPELKAILEEWAVKSNGS